jgi:DNA polymerase
MENCVCADNRVRGLFQFYGALRTGRWSGRLLQPQNLPQNHLPDLQARELVKSCDCATLQLLYDNVPSVLSELIRTAFAPKDGRKFIVCDFSAIEARVIAWLAGEKWRNDVFATRGKIYEASASQMFKIPIEEITKGSPLRQKGKIAWRLDMAAQLARSKRWARWRWACRRTSFNRWSRRGGRLTQISWGFGGMSTAPPKPPSVKRPLPKPTG